MPNVYRERAIAIAKKPLTRRITIGLGIFLVLFGLLGYLVLPGIVKSQAEKQLAAKLNRAVSIEKVSISPYTMTMSVFNMKVMEPTGDKVFVSFDELKVNASIGSLFRLAPVVQQIKLVNPYVHLVRTGPDRVRGFAGKNQPPDLGPENRGSFRFLAAVSRGYFR